MDGEVTERIKCTLPSWSGLDYKVPRDNLTGNDTKIGGCCLKEHCK